MTGDGVETGKQISDALSNRLQRLGINVAAGKELVFTLRFSEKSGDTLPIHEMQSPFDRRGQDTGRTIAERKGDLVIELTAKDHAEPLWRGTLHATSNRSFHEEINDASIRKSMIESMVEQIGELNLPYFMPKDPKALALPVIIE